MSVSVKENEAKTMRTVFALIDHPNLDLIIGPVILKLQERGVQSKVLVVNSGKADYLIKHGIPFQTDMNIDKEFLEEEGKKLFLNAADQYFSAHRLGRQFDNLCRHHSIPSVTVEHGSFLMGTYLNKEYLFGADKMAVIGKREYEEYRKLGVPEERLVLTGFPPFDEYFDFARSNPFVQGRYIFIAGQNHTFISEPGHYMPDQWVGVLRELYRILLTNFPDLDILIKPHPADPYHNAVKPYHDAIDPRFQSKITVLDSKYSNIQGISQSAFVVSFSTSVLLESLLLKKRALGLSISEKLPLGLMDAKKFGVVLLESSLANIENDIPQRLGDCFNDHRGEILTQIDVPDDFIENYIYKFDGKASERVADAILEMMGADAFKAPQRSDVGEKINRPTFKEVAFERYMRLMGIAEEVAHDCDGTYTILDIGSQDDFFRKLVPNADYFSYNGFISQGKKTPYKDHSYDIVVAADVLEHVTPADRKAFILELLRLARHKVVFSFPTEHAADFERFALTLVPGHRWLKEHIEQGLPRKADVDMILDQTGVPYEVKPNHGLASWLCSFILDHTNIDTNVKHRIDEFLQSKCFEMEKRETAYRYIYTVTISEGFDKKSIPGCCAVTKDDKTPPLVSIIIPVFNKAEYTSKCLDSILKHTPAELYEIVIVDNASTDNTRSLLQALTKNNMRVITNESNLGFAKACNQGAREASGKHLLFLNNDTEAKPGWLEPLLNILKGDPTVGAVGSKLLFPDGTIQHAGVAIVEDRKNNEPLAAIHIHYKKHADFSNANQKRTYQALTAACLLVKRDALLQVGGFDEGFWNGYEDVDLCFKLQKEGWKLVYQPESVLVHYESQSGPERFSKVHHNIARLYDRWAGKIKPDMIIQNDGSVVLAKGRSMRLYTPPKISTEEGGMKGDAASINILTFNQLKYTKECIESIQGCTPEAHEIIFVDNGSTDGTVKWLRQLVKKHANYRLIENKKNLGFAKGCNQGIQASSGEYILLLNNDVIVTEGWLDGMLRCLNSAPDVGIVGPMTNSISGPQRVPGADYGSTNHLEEYARSFREKNRDRRIPAKRIVGFCMLFKRELMEKIGLLDEQFGSGNFEDDDFCFRAALEGYRNLIAGDVFIHHYGSRSFIGNKIDYPGALLRNRKIFQKKWQGIDARGPLGMKLLTIHAMEKADELNQKDQVSKALETLSKSISYSPNERKLHEMLSEVLIDAKQFQEALEVLNQMPSEDTDIWKLERVGYCKEGLERHEEAEEIADLVLSLHPNSAFAWSLKGMVAYKKEDKETAESFFKKAIALDPGYGEPYTNLGVLKWTLDEKDEALDLLERGFILSPTMTDGITTYHSAIAATGGFERAERIFGEAKILYPFSRRIAFLLIDVLIQQGKNDAAMSEIEEAMIQFGIDDGMLSAALEMRDRLEAKGIDPESKGTVSLCMIVRNEEENLPRSLMSVKSMVDEMIVVDTGSTDRTREIARVFGAKVYDYEWADDFSGARNFSLSKAIGRWILIVDADEVISPIDHSRLTQIVKERNAQPVAYSLTTRNYVEPLNISGWTANDGRYKEEAGTGWFPGTKVRLFPNDPRIHFEHPVHELVEPSLRKAGIKIKECAAPIHHYGKLSMKGNQRKGEEYLLLGKKKLEERGGDFLSLYELAVQAGELGAFEEAVELWQKCIELQPENSKAHFNLGYAYLKLGRYEEALLASARAMELDPGFKEAVFNYSLCEFCVGDIRNTISVLEGLIVKEPRYPSAIALLSAAYLIDGKREQALEILGQMKNMGYDGPASLYAFADRLISASRMDAAISLLERAIETQNMNDQIVALLAQCKRTVEKRDQPCLQP